MRIPSRRMPRYQAPKARWLAGALGLGLVALLLAGLAKIWWPLAFLVPGAVVCLMLIGLLIGSPHNWRTAETRKGESICQFARGFDYRRIDTWIIRAVYEEFARTFPLRPSDRLEEDLLIDDEDPNFSATRIAQRTGRSLDGYERNPMYGKVKTLRDMVMFFHHQPLLRAAQARQQR